MAEANGTYLRFVYANYAARYQNPLNSYGQKSLKSLNEIARNCDQDNVLKNYRNTGLAAASGLSIFNFMSFILQFRDVKSRANLTCIEAV
jgi:hypothetical protein